MAAGGVALLFLVAMFGMSSEDIFAVNPMLTRNHCSSFSNSCKYQETWHKFGVEFYGVCPKGWDPAAWKVDHL